MAQQETLESKLSRMIDVFRDEFDKLSIDEKKKEQMISSLKFPCQIRIISSPYNNIHLMIITHLEYQDDKLIELINLKPDSFIQTLEEFASNPLWNIDYEDILKFSTTNFKQTMENIVVTFGKRILRTSNHTPDHSSIGGKSLHNSKLTVWNLNGNISEIDFDSHSIQSVKGYKLDYEHTKNEKTEQIRESIPDQNSGLGTFFYPPLLIGKFHPTISDKIQEQEYDLLNDNVIMTKFDDIGLVITKGGLIAIEDKNLEKSEKIFNTIMSTSLLFGIPLQALRKSEIASVSFDMNTHKITGSSWSSSSRRLEMFRSRNFRDNFYPDVRNHIDIKDMETIIKKSEILLKNEEYTYLLKLLLTSYTQMSNNDYSQSFITSWTIIEKNLYDIWMKKLISARVSKRIREDLDRWDLYRVLEILHLDKVIPDDEYYELRTLQSLRNEVIHEGHDVSSKMADKCYILAYEIIKKLIDVNISIKTKQVII